MSKGNKGTFKSDKKSAAKTPKEKKAAKAQKKLDKDTTGKIL